MRVKFSGKFASVQRDVDQWAKDHPEISTKAIWTIIAEYLHPTGNFTYRCPVKGHETRGAAASPEQTHMRVVGPCCYDTLDAAIADAKEGDTIVVTASAYSQSSSECYAVVACAACSEFHLVERNSGRVDPIEEQTRMQVAGLRK